MKIPRQGLHWTLMTVGGIGAIYAFARPTYDGEAGLEDELKRKYKHQLRDRGEANRQLREMLERSKQGEFDTVITPIWKQTGEPQASEAGDVSHPAGEQGKPDAAAEPARAAN
mmetsp:Transcript_7276/g.18585  ORF Transcript_7276/g.18585 Transcript_7276/m.18585 type:complete len:113 (-) Transcript_7276:1724-2062(-)